MNAKKFSKIDMRKGNVHSMRSNIASTHPKALMQNNPRLLEEAAPSSFDWSKQVKLTPVKTIGYCAASWTFAATAFFEADSIINAGAS